jgi:type VI protein secretion system component VasK
MKAIKKLFDTTTKLVVAIALLALLLVWVILFFVDRETAIALVKPILWSLLLVSVTWLAIHYGVKAWRKRKRTEFDERVAAKEGIEDRRREWSSWTEELEKQGIDRYELPFYLLVGEPQSGKSVLLHNSDLHFPFGQSRLSGVGGTRGCDWWFTEEAVILDLAGRLFTHEGGTADRLEFEAFLELLAEFRPLCPANGVILVIPCDSLLKDTAEQCGAKATKIQNALLALTTKLQAQLPVYLVLTKGDQVFGFAESVHRLDVERRHQMFGWSRPADRIDSPFDVTEVLTGYEELVHRARLLRAHMTAGARLPEALPEVDRMYAFPHELAGMQANLEVYLKRIFTASNVTDRVFFRGIYLTSGLQSGVPIAKVCTELFGQAGEADRRNLEALFSKQRAYFIKDLVRTRVFGERGLVRPTQGRVQQTRRTSLLAYGLAGAIVLVTLVFGAVYLLQGRDDEQSNTYAAAIQAGKAASADEPGMPSLLFALQPMKTSHYY